MRLLLLFSLAALASTTVAETLVLADAWARATPPGARTAAVYGTLANEGEQAVTVSSFGTDRASRAHLHSTVSEDGMMKMRQLDDLIIAPGETVRLQPGGMHIMLMELAEPLEEGASFAVTVGTAAGDESTAVVDVGGFGQMEAP